MLQARRVSAAGPDVAKRGQRDQDTQRHFWFAVRTTFDGHVGHRKMRNDDSRSRTTERINPKLKGDDRE